MKKIFSNFLKLSLIGVTISSCSFMNSKNVTVPVSSNPPGANLYIDGAYFGQTPTVVTLEPSGTHQATATKDGYGSATISMETWASVRGGRGEDSSRCMADAAGSMLIIPLFGLLSVHCRDFKEEKYIINIPNNGGYSSNPPVSMMPSRNSPPAIQQYQNPQMNNYNAYSGGGNYQNNGYNGY